MDRKLLAEIAKGLVVFLPVLVIAVVLFGNIVCGAGPFEDEQSLSKWIYSYHKHRDAESLVPAVRAMVKNQLIGSGYMEKDFFAMGFLSAVFSEHPDRVRGWLTDLKELSFPGALASVLSAVAASDTPQAREALNEFAVRADPKIKEFINSISSSPQTDLLTAPVITASTCDLLWGRYFATGDRRYVKKIIGALALGDQIEAWDIKAQTAEVAKHYLATYAIQCPEIMKICEEELKTQPENIRKQLEKIIAGAKSYKEHQGL